MAEDNVVNFDDLFKTSKEAYQKAYFELSSLPMFLDTIYYDRKFLQWALLTMMLDSGNYVLTLDEGLVKSLEDYNLMISGTDESVKFSIVFPGQKPEEVV